MNETIRLLHEKCLLAAKKDQTDSGLIAKNEKIALYDNFLFCLALFRSKTHENVLEAKQLLARLLYFQQSFPEVAYVGNFPLYISDFPHCSDHLQAIRCLVVLTYISKEFASILGAELKERLEHAMEKLKSFIASIDVKFPFWAKCMLASLGIGQMPDLADTTDLRTWGDPAALAELIVAYQLAPTDAWKPFWNYLSKVWHAPSKQYVGPAYKLGFQHPHFLVAMGLFTGTVEKVVPLYAALLTSDHQFEPVVPPATLETKNDRFSWHVSQFEDFAVSTLLGRQTPELMPGFFSYYLVTGPHSLAIQAPVGYSPAECQFEIDPAIFNEDKERARALVISFNDLPHNCVLVSGQKATCFQLTDPLEVTIGKKTFSLTFTKLSGDGEFVGHIARGNRSGHNQDRFTATDIQIFLRALRGTTPTTLQCTLRAVS